MNLKNIIIYKVTYLNFIYKTHNTNYKLLEYKNNDIYAYVYDTLL